MFLLLLYLFTKGYCLYLALQKGGFYVAKTMFLRTKKGVFASQKGGFCRVLCNLLINRQLHTCFWHYVFNNAASMFCHCL